jgi:hypothetical protein
LHTKEKGGTQDQRTGADDYLYRCDQCRSQARQWDIHGAQSSGSIARAAELGDAGENEKEGEDCGRWRWHPAMVVVAVITRGNCLLKNSNGIGQRGLSGGDEDLTRRIPGLKS